MIEFAAPLGLGALGAVAVPLLLHLVRRPAKVVRVGSLRLLPAQKLNLRSWVWRERLLLALRVLLLTLLVLALAGARWRPPEPGAVRWAFVLPGAEFDGAARAEWERLGEAGFERRVMTAGFPSWGAGVAVPTEPVDVWSLLREVDARVAEGSEAVVFGPATAEYFRGVRPVLGHLRVNWRPTPGVKRESVGGMAERPPVRVAVRAAPNRAEDARYLRAALEAAGAVLSDEAPAWIFQLGARPTPAPAPAPGVTVVSDAPDDGPVVAVQRTFASGSELVRLRQRTAAPAGATWLADSSGEPLITVSRENGVTRWRCALRFHPEWSDWPLDGEFPAWWREQFSPRTAATNAITPEMAAPGYEPALAAARPALPPSALVDLRAWCWVAAVVLFVTERVLSGRRRTA